MAHDTYGYEELMALVDNTKPQPFFMLEQLVTNSFVSRADKISFDEVFEDVRIAPFVSPVSDGDSVVHGGYAVRDFSPAYIKLDDPITLSQISNRVPGQALNTAIDRLSNLEQAIVTRLAQHRRSILTRLEWMAWQYARTGGQFEFRAQRWQHRRPRRCRPVVCPDHGHAARRLSRLVIGHDARAARSGRCQRHHAFDRVE